MTRYRFNTSSIVNDRNPKADYVPLAERTDWDGKVQVLKTSFDSSSLFTSTVGEQKSSVRPNGKLG